MREHFEDQGGLLLYLPEAGFRLSHPLRKSVACS